MDQNAYLVFHYDQTKYMFAMQIAFASFVLFTIIYFISGVISNNFKSYKSLNDGQKKEWDCRVVAFIHSVAAVIGATYALITFPLEVNSLSTKRYIFLQMKLIIYKRYDSC